MFLLMKHRQLEPEWRFIQKAMVWDVYSAIFAQVKDLTRSRDERGYFTLDQPGGSGRVTLNPSGVAKAILTILSHNVPVAVELEEGHPHNGVYKLGTTINHPLLEPFFPNLNFHTAWGQQTIINYGRVRHSRDLFPVLRKGVVSISGEELLASEQYTLSPVRDQWVRQHVQEKWFALFDPHVNTVSNMVENLLSGQQELEVTDPLGIVFACEQLGQLCVVGEHSAGGLEYVLSGRPWTDYETYHTWVCDLFGRVVEILPSDLPMSFCYRDYTQQDRPIKWGTIREGSSHSLLVAYDVVPSEDDINAIAVLDDTRGGYELVHSSDAPGDSLVWDTALRIWRAPVGNLPCYTCGEYQCEHLSLNEVTTEATAPVVDMVRGHIRVQAVDTPIAPVEVGVEAPDMQVSYIGTSTIDVSDINTSPRHILVQQLQEMGLSWDTVRSMCTEGMKKLMLDEFRRREQASRIQEPGDNREWLRSLVRNFDVRAPQRPDDVHPHDSYLHRVVGVFKPENTSTMSGLLDSTEKVQDVLRTVLQAVGQLSMRPQEVFGRNGPGFFSAAMDQGWGVIPLTILEKMAWITRVDKALPQDYDLFDEPRKKILLVKLMQGHQFGDIPRRGIKEWYWMDTRSDISEWQRKLSLYLAKHMCITPAIFTSFEDAPGYSSRKTIEDYGAEMLVLLEQGKLEMQSFNNLLTEHPGFEHMRAYRSTILLRGGIFGKYLSIDKINTLSYSRREVRGREGVGAYTTIASQIIGERLMAASKIEWDLNSTLSSVRRGNQQVPIIFRKSDFEDNPTELGLLYLLDDMLQDAVGDSTNLRRMITRAGRLLGIDCTNGNQRRLLNWPPLPNLNEEQQNFVPQLLRSIMRHGGFTVWKEKLGLHAMVPEELIPRLILNQLDKMRTVRDGIVVLSEALLNMGGPRAEELETIRSERSIEDEDVLRLVRGLGSLVIRRTVPENHEPDLMEQLLLGEMTVYDSGILDDL